MAESSSTTTATAASSSELRSSCSKSPGPVNVRDWVKDDDNPGRSPSSHPDS